MEIRVETVIRKHYLLGENFSCKICLEVLHDPVQCQNNEHYYCRKCITKHLRNSETCPLCMEQLSVETLRPPTRIVASVVSQLKKPGCRHVSRGCKENVQVEELLLHEQTCDYAPVACSNEGCKETVNRRDKESHETEECKYRKITCESCDEELVYVDYYKKHQCSLTLRKEIDEMKLRLDTITEILNQSVATETKHKVSLAPSPRRVHSNKQSYQQGRPIKNSATTCEEKNVAKGQIFIFGGGYGDDEIGKSVEVFNWSTKQWTLIKNCLFFQRRYSFSFLYGKKIMICGGLQQTNRVEYLNPSESGYTSTVASVLLPNNAQNNGLLHKDRILTFCKGVVETSLELPGESRTLLMEKRSRSVPDPAGVHCFGNNIYIVGREMSSMEKYDVVKNKMKILLSLPHKVSNMATVAYKDNIIILGGRKALDVYSRNALDDVVIFNVTNQEYKKLPSLLEKRYDCSAVIIGDVIVVMGGSNYDDGFVDLKTVEYYVIGDSAWQKLPAMNLARAGATACVYV